MGPEQKRLMDRLFGDPKRKQVNFNIFPGTEPTTPEALCAEINRAMDALERGECEPVDLDELDADLPEPTDVREIVKRRFGPGFAKPCYQSGVVECAMWECQSRNHCRYPAPLEFA